MWITVGAHDPLLRSSGTQAAVMTFITWAVRNLCRLEVLYLDSTAGGFSKINSLLTTTSTFYLSTPPLLSFAYAVLHRLG
jgi:hypothetical protein